MSPLLPERTSWSRVLGTELREARHRAGYTNADLCAKLGWSPAKVSRRETGVRSGSTIDLISFATACGVFGTELKRLMDLGARPWDGYWVQANGEPMPDELRSLIILETTATAIDYYQPLVIPALSSCTRTLRTVVGGPRVMRDQLMHLADLSKRGVCRIRIVPASTGGKASALGGSFMVLTHDDSATVNIELTATSLFLDSPSDVATYGRSLAVLDTRALTERQSLGVLRTWASKYAERARTGRLASARTWSGEV